MDTAPLDRDRSSGARRWLVPCFLLWLFGTPVLVLLAIVVGFDEWSDGGRGDRASLVLLAAIAVALLAPVAGTVLALSARLPVAALAFGAALVISVGLGVGTGVISEETLRDLPWRTSTPPVVEDGPGCQERSGGDNDCPGG